MFNVLSNYKSSILPRLSRQMSRFATCESGATTAEYVIIASVVVALGVAGVTTTRGGATVSANNTASAMEAQAPMFEKLANGQEAVRTAYAQPGGAAGSSLPPPDQNVTVMPVQGGGSGSEDTSAEAPSDNAEQNAGSDATGDQQTSDQDAEAGDDQDTDQSASSENEDAGTDAETTQDTSSGGTSGGSGSDEQNTDTPDEEEETEVVQNVKPGCENPYNRRGKIKRKCR